MDIQQLREIIQKTLKEYASIPSINSTSQDRLIFDTNADSYQWLSMGWNGMQRIFNVIIHIEIRQNLVWIERNNSSIEIGEILVEQGVPRNQIVLAFHAPYKRGLHGYATGE